MEKPTRILVPLDGSPLATDALDHALITFPGAEIIVLNVVVPLDSNMSEGGILNPDEDIWDQEYEHAEQIIEAAKQRALEYENNIKATVEEGTPIDTIINYVQENEIHHVVMGGHSRSAFTKIVLGSVAGAVAERSPVPVTIIH